VAVTRRDFVAGTAGALAGAAGARATRGYARPRLRLVALGPAGRGVGAGLRHWLEHDVLGGVLVELDLETGEARRRFVPLPKAHAATPLGGGAVLCLPDGGPRSLVVDAQGRQRSLDAAEGYVHAGHAVWLAEAGQVALTAYPRKTYSVDDTGRLEVFDLASGTRVRAVETGGIRPHEVVRDSRDGTFWIAHRGSLDDPRRLSSWRSVAKQPRVTALAPGDLRVRDTLPVPGQVTCDHLAPGPNGPVATRRQAVRIRGKRRRPDALHLLEEHLGRPLDYTLHRKELRDYFLELPLPPFGGPDLESTHPSTRGGRSVAFDPITGYVFVTFLEGQAVMRLGPDGARVVPSEDLHLEDPAGVTVLPGTGLVAFSGHRHDVVVVDQRRMETLRRFPVRMHGAAHLALDTGGGGGELWTVATS
jgi:hypothetical protein